MITLQKDWKHREVEDKVTGLKGIVISKCEYATGCIQHGVQPKIKKDGAVPDVVWIDAVNLKVTDKRKQPKEKKALRKDGPQQSTPKRQIGPAL